jgi:hypothetical protein
VIGTRRSFLRLEATVHIERHSALSAAAESILAIGGWIISHTLFSDVMAVVNFEFPADRSSQMIHTLASHGITVTPIPLEIIGPAETEIVGQLTLTFAQGSGDLRRDVPAFQ